MNCREGIGPGSNADEEVEQYSMRKEDIFSLNNQFFECRMLFEIFLSDFAAGGISITDTRMRSCSDKSFSG
jgi:hypothetical protein